jgi:hypothetical protein
MASVRTRTGSVLLVVDVQVGLVDGAWGAERVVDELNLAMRWFDYSGRRNVVAAADGMDFGTPAAALSPPHASN